MKPNLFLFAFFASLVAGSSARAANTISENEVRINRSALTDAFLRKSYVPLTTAENARIGALRADVLKVVKLNDAEFIRTVARPLPPESRNTVIRAMESFDVWACKGADCANCGLAQKNGCIRAKKIGDVTGVVAVIHPCLLRQRRCAGTPSTLSEWAETMLGWAAFAKITGITNNDKGAAAGLAGANVIRSTSSAVNGILGACPGPYSSESRDFLSRSGHLTTPNEAILKCGEKYLRSIQDLRKDCPEVSIGPAIESLIADAGAPNRRIARCDSFCQAMICQKKAKHPPLVKFGGVPTLLIIDDACEGERPRRLGEFVRWTLPESVRSSASVGSCVRKIDPNPAPDRKTRDDGTGLPPGPDIPLIQGI